MTRFRPPWLTLLALAACVGARETPPPPHEFLVSAGDSTFWVRGERTGVHVRGSPLLLARFDGRFHELYVTDDDRSYFDAVLIGQRVWRRDLITGDSLLVFEDSLVAAMAHGFARAHPDEVPLEPDEDASDDPEMFALAELAIVDVHGQYLSYEYHADVETRDGDESHLTSHGVLDLERAEQASLASIYGKVEASRIEAEGRRRFTAALDSILHATDSLDRQAMDALAAFTFDPRSFTILEMEGESAVAFAIPGRGPHAGGLALELDPISAGSPPWWERLLPTLPEATDDPLVDGWTRSGYDVLARYFETGDTVLLSLRDEPHEWPIRIVPAPVSRIDWLDDPPIDSTSRRALARAFDAAALYDERTRIALLDRFTRPARLLGTARVSRSPRAGHARQGVVVLASLPPRPRRQEPGSPSMPPRRPSR